MCGKGISRVWIQTIEPSPVFEWEKSRNGDLFGYKKVQFDSNTDGKLHVFGMKSSTQ